MPDKAQSFTTPDFTARQSVGTDNKIPDQIVTLPSVGSTMIRHAESGSVGFIPREDSDAEIAVFVASCDYSRQSGYDALGFMHLFTPDEAIDFANCMIEIAEQRKRDGRGHVPEGSTPLD